MSSDLEALINRQHGMVARRQLKRLGLHWDEVQHHELASRWVARTPRVISTFTGSLNVAQRRWLAVLHAGERSLLGGLTAASENGLHGWERHVVTILVDDELSFEPVAGVRFFRSRRPFELLRSPALGIPRLHIEPAVLLWAGYDAAPRAAHGVLAATIQQRLTTPQKLEEWTRILSPLKRSREFRRTISEIEGGSHSGAERAVVRMCRRYGMPVPQRQVARTDRDGRRRWTDAEWTLESGHTLVLEVDGSFHMDADSWQADLRRARRLTTPSRSVLRATSYELHHECAQVASDLTALGVPGRVPHNAL